MLRPQSDFRTSSSGQTASTIGDRLVFVALALYVTEIGTPTDVGIVLAAHAFPLVAFVLLGGVLGRPAAAPPVMVATDLVRFALHALLATLIFTGAVEIWHIVVIEAVFGSAEAFFSPRHTGLMPQTVPEDLIQAASAATGTWRPSPSSPARRSPPRSCSGVGAGLGVRARRRDVPRLRRVPAARAAARARRGARAPQPCSPSCARAGRGRARARVGVVDPALLLGCLLLCFRAVVHARRDGGRGRLRQRGLYGVLAAALGAGTIAGALIGFRWRPLHPMLAGMLLALPWPLAVARRRARRCRSAWSCSRSCSSGSGSRCSGSGGRPRWRSGCRRTCSRA